MPQPPYLRPAMHRNNIVNKNFCAIKSTGIINKHFFGAQIENYMARESVTPEGSEETKQGGGA